MDKDLLKKKIIKCVLNFDRTYKYFIDHITWKKLSQIIVKKIDFKQGEFFTILSEDASFERLYVFDGGWIIPPKPTGEIRRRSDGSEFHVQRVSTMESEFCDFIQKYFKSNSNGLILIENTNAESTNTHFKIEDLKTVFYGDEVYYLIMDNTPLASIQLAITKGCEVWHALIVFMRGIDSFSTNLEQQDFEAICKNLTHIVTTAYDGESYIFWERSPM